MGRSALTINEKVEAKTGEETAANTLAAMITARQRLRLFMPHHH
jgi:hypothetical protein